MRVGLFVLSLMTVVGAPLAAQTPPRKEIIYVEPAEDDYVGMILAATAWAKGAVSKSLGIVQRDEASPAWKRGVELASKELDLKVIAFNDFTMQCFTRQASRSAPYSRVCSMKGAEAILQFNAVRVAGDSGAIVTTVTRVPKGGSRTVTTHFCVALARKDAAWTSIQSDTVPDPDQCIR